MTSCSNNPFDALCLYDDDDDDAAGDWWYESTRAAFRRWQLEAAAASAAPHQHAGDVASTTTLDRLLVDPAADVEFALHAACRVGHVDAAARLMRDARVTTLIVARAQPYESPHAGIVALALRDGRATPTSDHLQSACDANRVDVVDLLLRDSRAYPPHCRMSLGWRMLHTSGRSGRVSMMRILLAATDVADSCRTSTMRESTAHVTVIALMLADGRADPCAAVVFAARHACSDALALLLRDSRVTLTPTLLGRIAVSWASLVRPRRRPSVRVVVMMSELGAVDELFADTMRLCANPVAISLARSRAHVCAYATHDQSASFLQCLRHRVLCRRRMIGASIAWLCDARTRHRRRRRRFCCRDVANLVCESVVDVTLTRLQIECSAAAAAAASASSRHS
jgi:hypothetical protein